MLIPKLKSRKQTAKRKIPFLYLFLFFLAFGVFISFKLSRSTFSASYETPNKFLPASQKNKAPAAVSSTPEPSNTPTPDVPTQTEAQRIKIIIGETQEFPIAQGITTILTVAPEIATAKAKNEKTLLISAFKVGETILIVSGNQKRLTYIIQVIGKPSVAERQNAIAEQNAEANKSRISGAVNLQFGAGFNGNPSLLRQKAEFKQKLSDDRTLRFSSEMFKYFGANQNEISFARIRNFGLNRMSLGIDSPNKSIDVLDSQIQLSTQSFNNFSMRGFHLVRKTKTAANDKKQINGLEIFAGQARPSVNFFDNRRGFVAGVIVPVIQNKTTDLRAGLISISPQANNRIGKGGTILQLNGSYSPFENLRTEGEVSFANGNLSWRARLDFKIRNFGGYGEIMRLDSDSPYIGIGAQSGGRKTENIGFFWQPSRRFGTSVYYNHTKISRISLSGLTDFDRSTFFANANYKISKKSQLNFRYSEQNIETAVSGSTSKFQIETRTFTLGHNIRFNQHWSNYFDGRINLSRETQSDSQLEKGFSFNEQLRFSFRRSSINGFLNYTNKTPSLSGLIIRNPHLLPPLLQEAFTINPAQFLQIYRDRAAMLLYGVELPLTRSLDTGVFFQTTISRFTLSSEMRYNAGEILAQKQKNFYTTFNVNFRIDSANSLLVSGWKSFGLSGQSALTFSFTHRFGAGSGEGFQFTKLFGFDRGKIQGRVYYDLNGNGQDDKDEPGVVGMTVQLDENRSVKTGINGRFSFSSNSGSYNVSLYSDDLGKRLRASTATQQKVYLSTGKTLNLSFGLSDFGFIGGRIFNNLGSMGELLKTHPNGIKGVRFLLRPVNESQEKPLTAESNGNGDYGFPFVRPGDYFIEIEPASLPANFQIPQQTSWLIKVQPLRGSYLDIPLSAQRAVAGIVFIDNNGDGRFNSQIDTPIEGANIIVTGGASAVSDSNGEYILRNLPVGTLKLIARSKQGTEISSAVVELSAEPETKRSINFFIRR